MKFRDSSENTDRVQNVWASLDNIIMLTVKMFTQQKKTYKGTSFAPQCICFAGHVRAQRHVKRRQRLSLQPFYFFIYFHPTQQDCVLPLL